MVILRKELRRYEGVGLGICKPKALVYEQGDQKIFDSHTAVEL